MRIRDLAKAVLAAAAALGPCGGAMAAASCDRACLDGMVDRYLAALVAHDPGRLPLAAGVRFTENGIPLKLGDALWGTASGLGKYKFAFEDPEDGQVGYFGTIRENDRPAILASRLRVVQQKIAEIETVVVRFDNTDTANGAELLDALGTSDAVYSLPVPPGQRASRQEMTRIVNAYFDGLEQGTAKAIPFDSQCDRLNNGELTTNNHGTGDAILAMGCAEQINSGFSKFISKINDRRYVLFDDERGLILAIVFFDHPGTMMSVALTDGTTFTVPPGYRKPTTLMVAELFKIVAGKIRRIDAIEGFVTYGSHSGWD